MPALEQAAREGNSRYCLLDSDNSVFKNYRRYHFLRNGLQAALAVLDSKVNNHLDKLMIANKMFADILKEA